MAFFSLSLQLDKRARRWVFLLCKANELWARQKDDPLQGQGHGNKHKSSPSVHNKLHINQNLISMYVCKMSAAIPRIWGPGERKTSRHPNEVLQKWKSCRPRVRIPIKTDQCGRRASECSREWLLRLMVENCN